MTSAMLRYSYIKTRHQFGKQCIFEFNHNVAEAKILPDENGMIDYVLQSKYPRHSQISTQFAGHEVATNQKNVKDTGMLHLEGGWPKEININDSENVQRYCRRIEKSDSWAPTLKRLLQPMEHCVRQNGTLNIHEEYFDSNVVLTPTAKYYDIRAKNSYADPETMKRPVRHLSWAASCSNRLAAAYAFMEFDKHVNDVSPYSYVWDIERSTAPLYALKSSSPIVSVEFNPRDPALLVGGLLSGQVGCWDMRTQNLLGQLSHPFYSHRCPVTSALWIPTKTNSEYFSTSIGGTVKWWDLRQPTRPSETLVMDVDQPNRADIVRSVGVTALQYEHTISSRFLAGMENGLVINVNRRSPNLVEKLASRYKCYAGPVIAIDRNPVSLKNFLVIGNGSAEVWGEDTKEGCYFNVCDKNAELSGGCWSTSRCSIFFTVNIKGVLKAYDVLAGMNAPLMSIHVCQNALTAINMHEDGQFITVGSCDGNIYLLECSEDFSVFTKEERSLLNSYLERYSRFEKALENRMKEIRLLQDLQQEEIRKEEYTQKQMAKTKGKKKEAKIKRRNSSRDSHDAGKRKMKKGGRGTRRWSMPVFDEAETNYFRRIEEESAKFTEMDEVDVEAAQELLKERVVGGRSEEAVKEVDKEDLKKEKASRRSRKKTRERHRKATDMQKEDIVIIESDSDGTGSRRKRLKKVLKKICETKVCKPEVCCQDMEEKGKQQLQQQQPTPGYKMITKLPDDMKLTLMENKLFRKLTLDFDQTPEMSAKNKQKILILKDMAPTVLKTQLQAAKQEMRIWQEKALAGTLCSWSVEQKLDEERKKKALKEKEKESARMAQLKEGNAASAKSTSAHRDSLVKKVKIKQTPKPKPKKQKDAKPTEEELKREKEQKRKELWEQMKQIAKECYAQKDPEVTYPRISSAFEKNFSELKAETEEKKNT